MTRHPGQPSPPRPGAVFFDASAKTGAAGGSDGGWGRTLAFGQPLAIRHAWAHPEVVALVQWAEAQSLAGRWVVLALAYEAAPAFDAALCVHSSMNGLPLAWAACHAAPLAWSELAQEHAAFQAGPWRALVPPRRYAERFARLREWIAEGETYQVNYTLPFEARMGGSGLGWFVELARAQAGGFCAWLDLGRFEILSLSPELFFRLDGEGGVLARPMKGTAPRGRSEAEDRRLREGLFACPKNRAENVMIVDLLRSDLGRVAEPGSVRAPRLFHVEEYPTLFQMTSDVRARLKPDAGLAEVLRALFPCGSITGAPKIRATELIRELEPQPRGLYCGAIGLLEPSPAGRVRGCFSVPIRTIQLDRESSLARLGVGGGVTYDSNAAGEYAECLTKLRFALEPQAEFELLESLLLRNGCYPLLEWHLERLARSAGHFGFVYDGAAVRRALAELARRHPRGRLKARLLLPRDGALRFEAAPLSGGRSRVRLGFAPRPVDESDELLAHKTTRRDLFEAALASRPDCDDVLLVNRRGEVTESTRASLVLLLDGELATPPLRCGLLPGVFRERLLARGIARERTLTPDDVRRATRAWLVNSVRWWMACELAGGVG